VIEQIPAYGVVRLDITPQGVPVNTMAGLSITFGEPTSEHETWPHVIDDIHLEPDHQANDWAFMSGFQADFRAIADLFDLSGIETPLELFDALDIHDPRQLVVMLDQGPMPGLVGAMMNNVLR
jgi:hypothetical protein